MKNSRLERTFAVSDRSTLVFGEGKTYPLKYLEIPQGIFPYSIKEHGSKSAVVVQGKLTRKEYEGSEVKSITVSPIYDEGLKRSITEILVIYGAVKFPNF